MSELSGVELFPSIEARVSQLQDRSAMVFVAVLSDRMLNNFRLYDALTEGGWRSRVDNVMALIWESLMVKAAKINFELQQIKLLDVSEALEAQAEADESGFGVRMAQDAVLALSICLESSVGNRPGAALEISRLSRSGVSSMIRLTNESGGEGGESEHDAWSHALWTDEVDFQNEVLEQLSSESLDKTSLQALKQLAFNEGVSNIGLSAEED